MFTGSESSPGLLTGLNYFLLKNPEVLQKVTREVQTAFKSSSSITLESVGALEYLSVCIQESLRAYPPAPLGVPRIVPDGGAMVASNWIPEKTVVYVSHFAAYGPANFSEADSFRPDRWLAQYQASYNKDQKAAMKSFGVGPRDCIGKASVCLIRYLCSLTNAPRQFGLLPNPNDVLQVIVAL